MASVLCLLCSDLLNRVLSKKSAVIRASAVECNFRECIIHHWKGSRTDCMILWRSLTAAFVQENMVSNTIPYRCRPLPETPAELHPPKEKKRKGSAERAGVGELVWAGCRCTSIQAVRLSLSLLSGLERREGIDPA